MTTRKTTTFKTTTNTAGKRGKRTQAILIFKFCTVYLLLWASAAIVQVTHAQDLSAVKNPALLGFDPQALQKINSEMQSSVDSGKMVGCAALIARKGKIAYSAVWGKRSREKELPVEMDTIWRIYSMSKPITSVAVMQLAEKGKLDLDDPVSKYISEFKSLPVYDSNNKVKEGKLPTVPARREMTIRDLLRHTSGLTYGFFGDSPVDKAYRRVGILTLDANLQDMTTKLSRIPLLHQPGTRFHYSASTDVLGRIVEVASGQSLKEYLQQNIFDPLNLEDTFFTVPKSKQNRFAEMYQFENDQLTPAHRLSSVRFINEKNTFYSGGGGLCSTMADYFRFSSMLLAGGTLDGKQILTSESIEQMTSNQLPKGAANPSFQFGLGFKIDDQGHYSWGGAAGTRFWVDPKNEMITLFMVQINPYRGGHGEKFKNLAYKALK